MYENVNNGDPIVANRRCKLHTLKYHKTNVHNWMTICLNILRFYWRQRRILNNNVWHALVLKFKYLNIIQYIRYVTGLTTVHFSSKKKQCLLLLDIINKVYYTIMMHNNCQYDTTKNVSVITCQRGSIIF